MSWRAIFIPILVVLTIVVIVQANSGSADSTETAGTAPASGQASTRSAAQPGGRVASRAGAAQGTPSEPATPAPGAVPDLTDKDAEGHVAASIALGALPAGADFTATGAGTWHVVPGSSPVVGTGGRHVTYTVEVEDGLQSAEQDQSFAASVDATLADPRSWIGGGQVSLARVDSGNPDFRITLTSQMTIRSPDQCGFDIPLEASCYNGWMGRVFINDARWVRGAMAYNGDLDAYHSYAVNHEVGHALGMRHEPCPAGGAPAPVMMQQSWSTSDDDLSTLDPQTIPHDGNVCVANPYPFPDLAGAPPAAAGTTAAG